MTSYDLNGLELTTSSCDTMNAYRLTAVDLTDKKFAAYAASKPNFKGQFSMHSIHNYSDSRDAAYSAQQFEKLYDKVKVKQLVTDKLFRGVCQEFTLKLEIPEWSYPAEGSTIAEMLIGKYDRNYVNNARDALREAFRAHKITQRPSLATCNDLMFRVETIVNAGTTYRNAAAQVISQQRIC